MAYTSGTSSFNLDLTELVEEAFERCGSQLRTGYDLKTAKRSINLLTVEWANRGINLWTIEEVTIPLVYGQAIYPVDPTTIDILDLVTRTGATSSSNQQDINMNRISESTYSTIPNKLTYGRPIQTWYSRQSGNANIVSGVTLAAACSASDTTITLSSTANLRSTGYIQIDSEIIGYVNISGNQLVNCYRGQYNTTAASHSIGAAIYAQYLPYLAVWPTPDNSTPYQLVYWRMRRIQDSGTGTYIQDIPFRFINCFVAGLAYFLSMKLMGIDPQRVIGLKTEYEQQFDLAAAEDRETAPIRWVPRSMFYSR
jgi:hypothetical protein